VTASRSVSFVNLRAQYESLRSSIHATLDDVVGRGAFIDGPELKQFERWFATFCGTSGAAGVASGTAALELILEAAGIGRGDEVIIPANTFIATAAAVIRVGARPVLVDVEESTSNLDPALLDAAITPRTRAIMPVHLYGLPARMDDINAVAARHGIAVIEDACQAHGARYKGRRAGSLGLAAAFSFYPAKNLGAFGDAGLVTSGDSALLERVRLLRDHGRTTKYEHAIIGQNARLDNLQAAILAVQARQLESWNAARVQAAGWYAHYLADAHLVLPQDHPDAESVFHLYVVRSAHRDALREHLDAHGVATGIHYPVPIHLQPACRSLGIERGAMPVTERLAAEILSLPMHPFLTEADVEYVADVIKGFAGRTRVGVASRTTERQ
jgi:dTDP-4-amino-4,6-dideoxygalactose transaminase